MTENDTGASRISDVERNLLVASTDLNGWNPRAISERSNNQLRKTTQDSLMSRRQTTSTLLPIEFKFPPK